MDKKNRNKNIAIILMAYGLLAMAMCIFILNSRNNNLEELNNKLTKELFIMEVPINDQQVQDNSE